MSSLANAIPNLIAAHPHALLMVLRMIKLGCLLSSSRMGFCEEKSEYASSIITNPSNFSTTLSISSRLKLLPVGLFGEQIQMIFVFWSQAFKSLSADNW